MTFPTLTFLPNEAGEIDGLGDAGIETFRNAPYASAAREAGQNTRDAAESTPVKLTFDVLGLPPDQIPAYHELELALNACAATAVHEKEIEFFKNARNVASAATIPVLRIADYNTRGLTGPPDEPGTPFHSLLKASGVSTKDSETSGGSFGIGKNASFAVSDLYMVMFSTRYAAASGSDEYAAQGKIKLVSHLDANGKSRRGTGYWGNPEGFTAVTDPSLVPDWLRRDDRGTSIFCMGFRQNEGWAELMTSSLVTNFFCAIHREEMVFEVDSRRFEVNRNSVESLLTRTDILEAAETSGQRQDLEFSAQLFRCLTSPLAQDRSISIEGLGDFQVRVLIDENLPRRIGFVRNGMYITDNLRHFGHPLKRFPGSRDFVALVEPVGGDAVKIMKRLENPAHDELSAARIADPAKRSATEAAMKKLGSQLRDLIRQATGVEHQNAVVLDELGKYFSQETSGQSPESDQGERDPETYRFTPPKLKPPRKVTPATSSGETGGSGGTGSGGGGPGGGTGAGTGVGKGGQGQRGVREYAPLLDVRNTIFTIENEPYGRRLYLTPDVDGPIVLTLQATGVNDTVDLRISGADKGTLKDGALVLDVTKGVRVSVNITLADAYVGPIEVLAADVAASQGAE